MWVLGGPTPPADIEIFILGRTLRKVAGCSMYTSIFLDGLNIAKYRKRYINIHILETNNPPNLKIFVWWPILNVWTVLQPILIAPWMLFCPSWRVCKLLRSERQNAEGSLSWKHWRMERELLSRCCRTRHLIGYLNDDLYCQTLEDGRTVVTSGFWWRNCQIIWYLTLDQAMVEALLRFENQRQIVASSDLVTWSISSRLQNYRMPELIFERGQISQMVPGLHRIRYPSSRQGRCNRTLCWLVVRYRKLIGYHHTYIYI